MALTHQLSRLLLSGVMSGVILLPLAGGAVAQQSEESGAQTDEAAQRQRMISRMQEMTQADGYLEAHRGIDQPLHLLGGPIDVTLTQDGGGVFVALPAQRELDPHVFGTPEMPRAFGGTPMITGVPPAMRGTEGGEYTTTTQRTPFGDAYVTMGNADLRLEAHDETAADAAMTEDSVDFEASWQDEEGNAYSVTCCRRLASHGLEYPTFGGVVTNHLLHGFSGVGTPLMPTEFAYVAFWGVGDVMKNGEVVDEGRLIHGMFTEYVRTQGYELGFDEDVNPQGRHFHLMVAPVRPNMEEGLFEHAPVQTGFTLPNGQPLPFWHVMFESVETEAQRG